MINIYEKMIARYVYEKTREFNLLCHKKMPGLKNMVWKNWLKSHQQLEYLSWVRFHRNTGGNTWTAEQRHSFSVAIRLREGWQLGERRDYEAKIDPWIIPWSELPEWMIAWNIGKDVIFRSAMRQF